MKQNYKTPVFNRGKAAKMLAVSAAKLKLWERNGLIKPTKQGKDMFYSKHDLNRLRYIKELVHKKGICISGVKAILDTMRCWEIKKCTPKIREKCAVYLRYGSA